MTLYRSVSALNLSWVSYGGSDIRQKSRPSLGCGYHISSGRVNGLALKVSESFGHRMKHICGSTAKMKATNDFHCLQVISHPQVPRSFPLGFLKTIQLQRLVLVHKSVSDVDTSTSPVVPMLEETLVGEDSASFKLREQKILSWVYFSVVLGVVLFILNVVWIDSSTGFGKAFIDAISSLSDSHEVIMFILILIFATVHSGLASLRDTGEKLVGERAYRVLFAGVSIPLALSAVVYFINHRYDGVQLWDLKNTTAIHQLVWLSNFISFFFLYPSTFNLLEVAAVDKPKMHLWETGIIRITRHPQMVGQVIWCLAHTVWIGNSVAVAASLGLIGHHLFGVWNGDRRLVKRYGEAFEAVKQRTSVIPFAAILDGRQKLSPDFYKEFLRLPYLSITALTLGAYFAHPLMQAASARLHW